MARDSFPAGVAEQLKWYVYRLIDPRNGETFYVGKGQEDRVFAHANGLVSDDAADISDPKLRRIKEIQAVGMEVGHVIHRHGMEEAVAYEVEAALIDAYPGLTNLVEGHGHCTFGSRHVEEVIAQYGADPFVAKEPLMLIYIGGTYLHRSIYDAVRSVWRVNVKRAEKYKLVLAHRNGVVVGAFRPHKWLAATRENFGDLENWESKDLSNRHGFVGQEAEQEIWEYYVRKRVPSRYRRKGIQTAVLYCHPDDA